MMGIGRINLALGAALAASLALNWATVPNPAIQGLEFAPQMAHAPRSNAFAPNPAFADGRTLQRPEPGTIPRGLPPLHYTASAADAERAGVELHNPFASTDSAALARGATVFATFCQPCHGTGGRGDGLVAQRGFPPPPSLLADHAVAMPDGRMFHVLTYGQNNMASYASQISRADRWKAILHVRELQRAIAAPATPAAVTAASGGGR
jgi:mono/diheme cytochrome c family protein